jgi:fluoride exporter
MGALDAHLLSPTIRLAVAIGFVGAYTTFSTFTYETIRLIEDGSVLLATANVFGSVLVGLLATIAGLTAGRGL